MNKAKKKDNTEMTTNEKGALDITSLEALDKRRVAVSEELNKVTERLKAYREKKIEMDMPPVELSYFLEYSKGLEMLLNNLTVRHALLLERKFISPHNED